MDVKLGSSLIVLAAALGVGCSSFRAAEQGNGPNVGLAAATPATGPMADPMATGPTGTAANGALSDGSSSGGSSTAPAAAWTGVGSDGKTPPVRPASAVSPVETSPSGQADPKMLAQVMAEVQAVGEHDRAAQDQLLAELRAAEPSMWPAITRSFRSRMVYSRQLREREATKSVPPAGMGPGAAGYPTTKGSATSAMLAQAQLAQVQLEQARRTQKPPELAQDAAGAGSTTRLPAADDAALPPDAPPHAAYPKTASPDAPPLNVAASIDRAKSENDARGVRPASFSSDGSSPDWRGSLDEAIDGLSRQLSQAEATDAARADHARLRLLQLAAGRRDDALQPIPQASPAESDFWSKEVFGLATLLDAKQMPEPHRRAAEARHHLNDATISLGEVATLEIRNVAFCRKVRSYGDVERFPTYVFQPGQRVLLYAEVENFRSEPTAKGFRSSLKSSYQIFDSAGHRVDQQASPPTEDRCDRPRRDYFIGCDFTLPKQIYPGKHTLKLTVEDLASQRVGESSIEFEVK